MTIPGEPDCVAKTLAWCNEKLAEQGKDPLERLPKGGLCDPMTCPCGKATGLHVGTHNWALPMNDGWSGSLPPAVVEFVSLFDAGGLPQYEEDQEA